MRINFRNAAEPFTCFAIELSRCLVVGPVMSRRLSVFSIPTRMNGRIVCCRSILVRARQHGESLPPFPHPACIAQGAGRSADPHKPDVWLIRIQKHAPAVALTSSEKDPLEFNILSPDGRHVVYGMRLERGTSLWLADLGDALVKSHAKSLDFCGTIHNVVRTCLRIGKSALSSPGVNHCASALSHPLHC